MVQTNPTSTETPAVPAKEQPTAPTRPKITVKSLSLTLHQDLFDEIALLIVPIAKAMALETKIEDQHIKRKIPLLGEKEVATAINIKIDQFVMGPVELTIDDGFLKVNIKKIELEVSTTVKAIGANLGVVKPKVGLTFSGIVKLTGGASDTLKVDVDDVKSEVYHFDLEIGSGVGGDILETITDFFTTTIKKTIADSVIQPIDDALTQGLEGVLGRPMDIAGQVSTVGYTFLVGFLGDPKITKANGVQLEIGVDTHIKEGLKPLPPVVTPPSPPAQ